MAVVGDGRAAGHTAKLVACGLPVGVTNPLGSPPPALHAMQGSANTKTRSEVRGGGKKPYKQKGTGNARRGSNTSPLFPGGGITFGPKVRGGAVYRGVGGPLAAAPAWRVRKDRSSPAVLASGVARCASRSPRPTSWSSDRRPSAASPARTSSATNAK